MRESLYYEACLVTLHSIAYLQGFLGLALLIEGLLFAFHLKGTALDVRLHLILVLVILFSSLICFLEIQHQRNFVLSTVRAQLMLLQGLWFYQIAAILFKGTKDTFFNSSLLFILLAWITLRGAAHTYTGGEHGQMCNDSILSDSQVEDLPLVDSQVQYSSKIPEILRQHCSRLGLAETSFLKLLGCRQSSMGSYDAQLSYDGALFLCYVDHGRHIWLCLVWDSSLNDCTTFRSIYALQKNKTVESVPVTCLGTLNCGNMHLCSVRGTYRGCCYCCYCNIILRWRPDVAVYLGIALHWKKSATYQQVSRDEESWNGVNGRPQSIVSELELNNAVHRQ